MATVVVVAVDAVVAVVAVVVVVVVSDACSKVCLSHSCDDDAAVSEINWWRVTWESRLPATPPPRLCLTQEKLF